MEDPTDLLIVSFFSIGTIYFMLAVVREILFIHTTVNLNDDRDKHV